MTTTEQRLAANRVNALQSTGPVTADGKAIASRNATRHGFLSTRLFLDDENPDDFHGVLCDLDRSLVPVGAMESALVERIAVTLWRQRRLVHAETATVALGRQLKKIAGGVSSELGRGYGAEVKPDELAPFDAERETWCRTALAEIEALTEMDLATIELSAPVLFEQLKTDAEGDPLEKFIDGHEGGLPRYLASLSQWCREQMRQCDARQHILAVAEQVRIKRMVLSEDALVLLSRYQTTLDNQLFKLLRALREAQEWRLKTLEAGPECDTKDAQDVTEVP